MAGGDPTKMKKSKKKKSKKGSKSRVRVKDEMKMESEASMQSHTAPRPLRATPNDGRDATDNISSKQFNLGGVRKRAYAPQPYGMEQMMTPSLSNVVRPHLDSFNFFLDHGVDLCVDALEPLVVDGDSEKGIPGCRMWIDKVDVLHPRRDDASAQTNRFPNECRELGVTYEGQVVATVVRQVEGGPLQSLTYKMGAIPLMVKSSRCHLQHMSRPQLVQHKEEESEMGGYFILNGIERIIRMIVAPRRNVITALVRPSFQNRGRGYTKFATVLRCVRPDQSSQTITLHYLNNGSCNVRFSLRKQEFFVPAILLLKALSETTEREIFERIVQGDNTNSFVTARVELMIRESRGLQSLGTRDSVLAYLGNTFRIMMGKEASMSDVDVGRALIKSHLFVHCVNGKSEANNNRQKYDLLIMMIQKLYALVQGRIKPENPDALSNHELLLPGHLYGMIFKEKLHDWLVGVGKACQRDMRIKPQNVNLTDDKYVKKLFDSQPEIGNKMRYFIVTGNLVSNTGLDLMQVSGFTIVAEKLNFYRYLSHFRSVHRGQFFTTMKTTTVRKLLPESWGFMCPVHTPDGSPCGLLNHLSAVCYLQSHFIPFNAAKLTTLLCDIGMTAIRPARLARPTDIDVTLDGVLVGRVPSSTARAFAKQLRLLKVKRHEDVPFTLEIACVFDGRDGMYPCISLHTDPARMLRPVRYLATDKDDAEYIEWVGPAEQINMEIACLDSDFRKNETTHQEISPTSMLSIIAGFTPFSDQNQSCRNMYQCQMGKQTMGTPFHSFPHRTDNKVYRIQTPQTPLVRCETYDEYELDEYPLGTNSVVAVISYTGYDMEDAMIINKGAYDRGFMHASVYKHKNVDLGDYRQAGEPVHHRFNNVAPPRTDRRMGPLKGKGGGKRKHAKLDRDGLPMIGEKLTHGDPVYAVHDDTRNTIKATPYKEPEEGNIEEVRVRGDAGELQRIGVKIRMNRNPLIGDKFASRAGQKGVMSVLFPQHDMPFSEAGITPDIIINPHAFPSRMTVGMLVESMAGKSGAAHARFQDSTPFKFHEDARAVDYFGEQLVKAGYNYAGTEQLYSGLTGEPLTVNIFMGVVYYQRLRHMVSDKSQVRATGPVNPLTRQPIKGRKVHGGIRFGEMERDSLLGHGASFLLQDRLMNCSDYHATSVCTRCGSMLAPINSYSKKVTENSGVLCRNCNSGKHCSTVAVPYVFMYLANELAAMNIRLSLDVK